MRFLKYFLASLLLVFIILFFDLFRNRNVKIYEEYEVYSERELLGLAWLIISSQEQATAVENKQGVVFPSVDFSKYYLLESQGRRINSLKYKKISRFSWDYNIPVGIAEFTGKISPHTIYVYKIDKHKIKQNGD
ncbi:MAG: hypothetical protein IJ530_13825 [Treponema sp.]|uniref:hypothetical protein n=1 Tax=Treponema sp. TaxID=166 RepID=UPI002600DCB6|nr:hypothetical protein [Treponema sp.]MBQ8680809.1 hypothetical protein [Treponema sp.]